MTEDLETKLKNRFPMLLGRIYNFECSDGWFALIDSLSASIQSTIDSMPEQIRDDFYAVQIKEKFGTLRYYMNNDTPYIRGAISMGEHMSAWHCEVCGNVGSTRNIKNYIQTLCDKHYKVKNAKR